DRSRARVSSPHPLVISRTATAEHRVLPAASRRHRGLADGLAVGTTRRRGVRWRRLDRSFAPHSESHSLPGVPPVPFVLASSLSLLYLQLVNLVTIVN